MIDTAAARPPVGRATIPSPFPLPSPRPSRDGRIPAVHE